MDLIQFYKSVLATGNMKADEHGYISHIEGFDKEGSAQMQPVVLAGKRLVLPVKEQLRTPEPDKKIFFNPLSEDVLSGESEVFIKLKDMCSIAINFAIVSCIDSLISLGLSTKDHPKLSPDDSAVLSILKNVDMTTSSTVAKIISKAVSTGDFGSSLCKIYQKRGGKVKSKRYARVGIVSSAFYEEVSQNKEQVYGVNLRKKDRGLLKALMEFILPKIAVEEGYNQGSDDDHAPYLASFLKTVAAIAEDINKVIDTYSDFIDQPDVIRIKTDWADVVDDFNSFIPELRRIPHQTGNRGSMKVEDKLKEERNISQAVQAAVHQAQTKQVPAQPEKPAPVHAPVVETTTPPFDPDPVQYAPVPTMAAPVPQVHQEQKSGMSVSDLIGVGAPNVANGYNQYQQPYPQQYQQPYGQYPMQNGYGYQQPMYPPQAGMGYGAQPMQPMQPNQFLF